MGGFSSVKPETGLTEHLGNSPEAGAGSAKPKQTQKQRQQCRIQMV
jgi:hypothetical protein